MPHGVSDRGGGGVPDHFEAQMHPGRVARLPSPVRVLRRTGEVLLAILAFLFGG
jgi:hypothetical protein